MCPVRDLSQEAKKLIEASGFKMIVTDDLEDAANKAVKVAPPRPHLDPI